MVIQHYQANTQENQTSNVEMQTYNNKKTKTDSPVEVSDNHRSQVRRGTFETHRNGLCGSATHRHKHIMYSIIGRVCTQANTQANT